MARGWRCRLHRPTLDSDINTVLKTLSPASGVPSEETPFGQSWPCSSTLPSPVHVRPGSLEGRWNGALCGCLTRSAGGNSCEPQK